MGAAQGAREQARNLGDQIQEGAQRVGEQLQEGWDTTREEAARRLRSAQDTVASNPMQSVLVGFGVGFGLGLVLTTILARPEPTWAERHLPDSLRNAPDSLQDLAGTLRELPERIASRISNFRR